MFSLNLSSSKILALCLAGAAVASGARAETEVAETLGLLGVPGAGYGVGPACRRRCGLGAHVGVGLPGVGYPAGYPAGYPVNGAPPTGIYNAPPTVVNSAPTSTGTSYTNAVPGGGNADANANAGNNPSSASVTNSNGAAAATVGASASATASASAGASARATAGTSSQKSYRQLRSLE
ncbi:hypothetical protein PHYSODRAFT_256140 [Phytophthora sojae]|uniref:Uncharacterized protein n=1 Tax=Phytophthora sojae (strain P6497) TaxID=1094619 RepID=G4ZSG4_PHYSP|nr:hypothetical protein PHYSODRAFT_256140 [Phytophthora sojae]EGZ14044.1 hypothetical protein PHYSODRAFT_256140 [Phytophthora sojae]|eukprot:XP_009531473.1 hypothetical protein PHYSODRAFT_256140 [Phytophthora sojae]